MSGSIRLFIAAQLCAGAEIAATQGQAHYLGTVMRRSVGDSVVLFNGRDGAWTGRIMALARGRATFAAESLLTPQAAEPDIWLMFAPLKRDATDLVIQKATELGASALLPVLTERTNVARSNIERLSAIAIEAAEQSERLTVPRIEAPRRLLDVLGAWPPERRLMAAIERTPASWPRPTPGPAALLVGPEGGFTQPELDGLRATSFVLPVSFGPRILRAETAAIAGLALMQAWPRDLAVNHSPQLSSQR